MSERESRSEESSQPRPTTSPQFSTATQPSYAQTLFFEGNGLRPGWGLAFYVITFLVLQKVAVELAWARDLGSSGLWSMMLEEFGNFIAAALPAIILTRVENRSWGTYGLPFSAKLGRRLVAGAIWGFAGISLLMLALFGAHNFQFGHIVLHGARVARFAVFWAVMFLLVGLVEEFLFRGYTLFTLERGIRFWPAAIVLSATFGLIHLRNGGEQWAGALAAAAIGFFFCFTLRRTGNLWFAVGFHAAWDWGETFFYSVPDSGTVSPGHLLSSALRGPAWLSGGSVGPEGSVLCFVVIALVWIAFDRMHPKNSAESVPLQETADSSSLRSSE